MLTRRIILAGVVASAASVSFGSRAGASKTFRIGYQKNGILAVAKERGTIEARIASLGFDVSWVEFSYGPPLLEALSLGSIDFGQTGDAPPIFAQSAGANLVYVAAQPRGGSGSAILLPSGSEIQNLVDLKGKRVAFAKGSSAHNFTIAALGSVGLSYRDIEPVILTPADAAAAFARGAIDAWTVWDPYFAIAEQGAGVRVLVQAAEIGPTNNFFLANKDVTALQPRVITAANQALAEVATWCEANRDKVADSLSKATGVPIAATRRTVGRIRYTIAPMDDAVTVEQQRIADRFYGLGLIPRAIRISEIVWAPPGDNANNG